ncbi:alanine--tRNA ligase-related protein [Ruminococcus sp.]|uniref:alanyl-tRNA editing protein n=1 Tax=Ruminococcus sp. TaxID=41978 RepID=UPI0025FFF1FD|nr:alanine--tRNA ligase-related protein [Ruminococcus sp.]MBQ8965199.1 alanyl-tRNA editing protein [Ruminococcus sp.]
MTEKLFDDGELLTFVGTVVSCTENGKFYDIVLDRTAFFPEGGGQTGDTGKLCDVCVMDTVEIGGEVVHKCDKPLEVGEAVCGRIDKDQRLRKMQNHSGEHLLMGFIHAKLGYDNIGFHLGSREVTLDLNGVISAKDLLYCEQAANEAIARDVPITISYPDSAALEKLEYRSKLEMTENVRIVTIEGIDSCACCAPHVSSTGKIGIIKVISSENYKGGTRLHILCGLDALDLFRQRLESTYAISKLLSAKPEKIAEQTERLLSENILLKRQLADIERRKAEDIISSLEDHTDESFCIFTSGLSADTMRSIANEAVKHTNKAVGVFCENSSGHSYIIASQTLPLRSLAKQLNTTLGGKGGGSDQMIQGSLTAEREVIENYFCNDL